MSVRELVTRLTPNRNGKEESDEIPTLVIEPSTGWNPINLRELWAYRDLFYFLVWRDIKYGLSFAVRLLMYAAPVVYPASYIPQQYRLLYGLNPMAGVIKGFRAALLDTRPMPWDLLAVGTITAIVIAISGAFYFRRMERIFADVV